MDDNSGGSADTHLQRGTLFVQPMKLLLLPPEVISRITHSLSLCSYSHLSRTCKRLHRQLFHPSELILFLKTRYRLSVESGSIILFAYLANLQIKAPLLLERIFDDFFADSAFHEQERHDLRALHRAQALQRIMPAAEVAAQTAVLEEQTRRQAKRDAVRMWGVLYALDKTPAASPLASATCALVLSGATDAVESAKQKQKLKQKQEQSHQTPPKRHANNSYNNNSGSSSGSNNNQITPHSPCSKALRSSTRHPPSSLFSGSPVQYYSKLFSPPSDDHDRYDHHPQRLQHDKASRSLPYRSTVQMRSPWKSGSGSRSAGEVGRRGGASPSGWTLEKNEATAMDGIEVFTSTVDQGAASTSSTGIEQEYGGMSAHGQDCSLDSVQYRVTNVNGGAASSPCNSYSYASSHSLSNPEHWPPCQAHPPSKQKTVIRDEGEAMEMNQIHGSHGDTNSDAPTASGSCSFTPLAIEFKRNLVSTPPSSLSSSTLMPLSAPLWPPKLYQHSERSTTTINTPGQATRLVHQTSDPRPSTCSSPCVTPLSARVVAAQETINSNDDEPVLEPSIADGPLSEMGQSSLSTPRQFKKSRWSESPSPPPSPQTQPSTSSSPSSSSPGIPCQSNLAEDKQVRVVRVGPSTPVISSGQDSLNQDVGFFLSSTRIDRSSPIMIEPFHGRLAEPVTLSSLGSFSPPPPPPPPPYSTGEDRVVASLTCGVSPASPPPLPATMNSLAMDPLVPPLSTLTFPTESEPCMSSSSSSMAVSCTAFGSTISGGVGGSGHSSSSPEITTTTKTLATTMTKASRDRQALQNSRTKIEFLTRYTDRMRLKLEALGIDDWRVKDIQRKKTYQMMIQQNDRSGESELVHFYLDRYGGTLPEAE